MKCLYLSRLPQRIALCGMAMLALIVVLTACGGASGSTANTSPSPTNGITAGTTDTPSAASPTSIPTGTTPTPSHPGPTSVPTRTTPTPTPGRPSPTPSPTQTPPKPSPTPSPTPAPPPPVTVMIITNSDGSFAFGTRTLNIPVGTTVTWKNTTIAPHTVSFNGFGSGTINPGGTYSFTFAHAGTFGYMCMFHPYMMATVIVK